MFKIYVISIDYLKQEVQKPLFHKNQNKKDDDTLWNPTEAFVIVLYLYII